MIFKTESKTFISLESLSKLLPRAQGEVDTRSLSLQQRCLLLRNLEESKEMQTRKTQTIKYKSFNSDVEGGLLVRSERVLIFRETWQKRVDDGRDGRGRCLEWRVGIFRNVKVVE